MNRFFGGSSSLRVGSLPEVTSKRDPSTATRARAQRGNAKPRETPLRMTVRLKDLTPAETHERRQSGDWRSQGNRETCPFGQAGFCFSA
jgi:hypothetical protein